MVNSGENRRAFGPWIWGGGGNNNGSVPGWGNGDAFEDGGNGEECENVNVLYTEEATFTTDSSGPSPKRSSFGPWSWLSALWEMYTVSLRQSPMLTKAVTSGVLALSGEIVAQYVEFQQKGRSGLVLLVRQAFSCRAYWLLDWGSSVCNTA